MKVVILAGGLGSRLSEETSTRPKPMVEIGGRPILWHVLNIYLEQGFERAILCCGYKGEMIADFAAGEEWPEGVSIEAVDTGLETPTGGKVYIGKDLTDGTTSAARAVSSSTPTSRERSGAASPSEGRSCGSRKPLRITR